MLYTKLYNYSLWLLATLFVFACVKPTTEEIVPEPGGEKAVVLQLSGGVQPFDAITKAPEEFTPSSSNLLYLLLLNKEGDYAITGKGSYNEGSATWLFTYEGSVSAGLTSGDVYGYLFEKEWGRYGSGADEYIQLGPKVPVYEATSGTFSFTQDTLFVNAQFAPTTSRISFTQDLADNRSREVRYVSGLWYCDRFYPNYFSLDLSGEQFYGGSASNKTYYYGLPLFPDAPVLIYNTNGYTFVKRFSATAFQAGDSGSVYLPQDSNTYEGWKKYNSEYGWYIDGTRNMFFRFVSCGSFDMGGEDAQPSHRVTITDSFYMMDTEVDQALWYQIMGEPEEYQYQSIPVTGKSWEEIQAFIAKMSAYYKCHFRLPTEAEWEYAARGGMQGTAYYIPYTYSGSDRIDDVAWYSSNSTGTIHTVRTLQDNALTIYDMSGNVAELCSDWYADYKADAVTDPRGPETGKVRVVRGGSYGKDAEWCSNTRRGSESDYDPSEVGFRLVLIPPSFTD